MWDFVWDLLLRVLVVVGIVATPITVFILLCVYDIHRTVIIIVFVALSVLCLYIVRRLGPWLRR